MTTSLGAGVGMWGSIIAASKQATCRVPYAISSFNTYEFSHQSKTRASRRPESLDRSIMHNAHCTPHTSHAQLTRVACPTLQPIQDRRREPSRKPKRRETKKKRKEKPIAYIEYLKPTGPKMLTESETYEVRCPCGEGALPMPQMQMMGLLLPVWGRV